MSAIGDGSHITDTGSRMVLDAMDFKKTLEAFEALIAGTIRQRKKSHTKRRFIWSADGVCFDARKPGAAQPAGA